MKPPSTEPDLTFHWPVEKGFPFVLFVCVAGSLLAHATTFFLFQVVYPQRVTIPQPAPHVSLLTASSPENIALLRWIEAEDPALISSDNSIVPPGLVEVHYRPSFATLRTTPLGAPAEESSEVRFPPAVDQLSVLQSVGPSYPSLAPLSSTTLLQFAGALAGRSLISSPPLDVIRRTTTPVNPTVLLIGVDQHGGVRLSFLQQPCGDSQLDALAIAHLSRLNFAPAETAVTWGHATFSWGADAYVPPPIFNLGSSVAP
jgi:hypothetical protein